MNESHRPAIPAWLPWSYGLWMVIWVPSYWLYHGPLNFLWFCDVANFVVAVALWRRSRLLFSSQAVGVLLIQLVWTIDFAGRLLGGGHPIGGTEYMFDPSVPIFLRALSLFHLWIPVLLLWAVLRLGYDRRGWWLQTALAWVVLPLSTLGSVEQNLNWIHAPFGIPQTWTSTPVWVAMSMVICPLVLYLPSHLVLQAIAGRFGRRCPAIA